MVKSILILSVDDKICQCVLMLPEPSTKLLLYKSKRLVCGLPHLYKGISIACYKKNTHTNSRHLLSFTIIEIQFFFISLHFLSSNQINISYCTSTQSSAPPYFKIKIIIKKKRVASEAKSNQV